MCHFVSATLPSAHALARVEKLPGAPASFFRVTNPGIERQLQPGEVYCGIDGLQRGGCFCGTVIGAGRIAEGLRARQVEQARRKAETKLRKKGWSAAKIEAWLDQKEHASTRTKLVESRGEEAARWIALVQRVVSERKVPYVGLLLHFYHAWIDAESFPLGFEDLRVQDLDEARLAAFNEDVLYRIRAQ